MLLLVSIELITFDIQQTNGFYELYIHFKYKLTTTVKYAYNTNHKIFTCICSQPSNNE